MKEKTEIINQKKYICSINYSTIGHHTVEDRDNIDYIENHAPFKCSNRSAWLSYGYYFWEQDLERAIEWGEKNYLT